MIEVDIRNNAATIRCMVIQSKSIGPGSNREDQAKSEILVWLKLASTMSRNKLEMS